MEIQPHDFRFTLYSEGKTWVLPQAPDGWEESTLQWARSVNLFGLIKSFSVPLRFVLDGAWLLRRVAYKEGIDGVCVLKIELLNRNTWQYQTLYEGDIDFSTFDDTLTAVETQIMEMGVSASISAYSNVEYEFPVLEEDTVQVRLPGIDRVEVASGIPFYLSVPTNGYYPGISVTTNEFFSDHVTMQPQEFYPGITRPIDSIPDGWFLQGNTNPSKEIRIWGNMVITGYTNNNYYYRIEIVDSGGTVMGVIHNTIGTEFGDPDVEHQFEFDMTLDIWDYPLTGGRFYIKVVRYGAGGSPVLPYLAIVSGEISVSYGITTEPSIVRAYKPKVLLQKLIDRMYPAGATVQSSVLEEWDNLLIASGDSIRSIQGALLKTNFNDYFKSINAVLNVGFGIQDGVPVLEKKSYFFRSSILALDLKDSAKDIHIRPAEEFMFNSIKAGYPNDNYEVDQGREEYNSGQVWSTNIRRLQKQLDIQSVYRADQYGIEQLRIAVLDNERDNVNEKDKKNDNEVFFIHAKKTPGLDGIYDVIGAENYTSIQGISTRSSSYNLEITPKKNMLRHSDYLAGALYGNASYIRFESADKNANLGTTDIFGRTVWERQDIEVSSLGNPLFLPWEAELTTDLPFDAWKLLQTNSSGYIRFEYREHEFYGFILEVSQNIERNAERTFRLLLTSQCDITKLID